MFSQGWKLYLEFRELFSKYMGSITLNSIHNIVHTSFVIHIYEEMYVVWHNFHLKYLIPIITFFSKISCFNLISIGEQEPFFYTSGKISHGIDSCIQCDLHDGDPFLY